MTSSLVGSEMCIRDSLWLDTGRPFDVCGWLRWRAIRVALMETSSRWAMVCLLYTSDAADDM
eukprot:1332579-Prorocentrum_lima.AAC.1